MLNSLSANILTVLEKDFQDFAFGDNVFGLNPFDSNYPYFTIIGRHFKLKKTVLKNKTGVSKVKYSDTFIIPIKVADKKGPFHLSLPPSEIDSIVAIEKPGLAGEAVSNLVEAGYKIEGKALTLNKAYTGNTKLVVSYTIIGVEFTDRFEQQFVLKIYEEDALLREKYSALSIAAIWGNLESLLNQTIQHTTGDFLTRFTFGDYQFLGQEPDENEPRCSNLTFATTGIANFVKARTDGFDPIKEVDLGENKAVLDDKGIAIGFEHESD